MPQPAIDGDTLDDLMRESVKALIEHGTGLTPTRGSARELTAVRLTLSNPRARLSRSETRGKIFSSLGETLWYLSGRDDLDFIGYYVKEYQHEAVDGVIKGGYGPRLRGRQANGRDYPDQLEAVRGLLASKPGTRRAVIQVFDAQDLEPGRIEVPCTCTLQFLLRGDRLDTIATMRSNDAYKGLPHDIFAFTFIQELVAASLGVALGSYTHFVGSLHLYDRDLSKAQQFLDEGWQSTTRPMPPMPQGDPWPAVEVLLEHEGVIRKSDTVAPIDFADLDAYWADLVRLLQIYRAHRSGLDIQIPGIGAQLTWVGYNVFLERFAVAGTEQ